MFIEVISRLMAGPNMCIAETFAGKMLRFDQRRNCRILQMIVEGIGYIILYILLSILVLTAR